MSAAEPPAGGAGPGSYPAIIVRGDALDRLRSSSVDEAGSVGVLVGNAAPSTNFVLVTAHLAADTEDPDAAVLGSRQIDLLTRLVSSVYPGQRIVGWYRTRSDGGIFLSGDDLDLQRTSFANPWHVGYVYDASLGDGAFFGWSNGEIVRVPRWEITSVEVASGAALPIALAPEEASVDEPSVDEVADAWAEPASTDIIEEPTWAAEPDDVDEPADDGDAGAPDLAVAPIEVDSGESPSSSVIADSYPPPPTDAGAPLGQPKKRPSKALIAVVIGAVAAIVITALALSSGDDDDGSSADTTDVSAPETDSTQPSSSADTTLAPSSSVEATTSTSAPATSSTTAGSDVPPASIDLPATPAAVTPAADRAGPAAAACEETGDNEFAPISDCHVPLPNGNVLLFVQGSLRCTEPAGRVIANEAQAFMIGAGGDPLAIVADGALVQKCSDVTYARNVMAGGSETLDGLCGSSGTQINEATARCFGYSGGTGAVGAVVRGTGNVNALVASCFPSTGEPARSDLDWSSEEVSTLWRIDSVTYDPAVTQFVAVASRNGATANASFACA